MSYCTKCGKPTDNEIMCEECIILDSPWLCAMKSKEFDLTEQIKNLKAENAALRERLEKAIELPCKIGDEVYEVHGKCDRKNCVYNGYYGQWRCDYGGKTNCNPFITVNKFRYCDIPMVGKTIFVTKEEAEARLNELKGEKK